MSHFTISERCIKQAKDCGKEWSLLFHEFSYCLLTRCQQLNIKKIYFFTREGAFYLELAKALKNKFNFHQIELHLLCVSRLATFLASVNLDSDDAFQRLWNIYPNQSPKSFFMSLGIEDSQLKEIYVRDFKGSYDEIIVNIANDSIFKQFLKNRIVRSIIASEISYKKTLLQKYLEQNSFFQEDRIMVVDIGWRGSIQDNLSIIFPEKKMYGFYFGLHRFKEKFLQSNKFKEAFLFNANCEKSSFIFSCLMRFVLPLEFLSTPAEGSVIGYVSDKDSKIIPKFKRNQAEKMMIARIICPFQQSVIESIAFYQPNHAVNFKISRKIAKQIVWDPKEFQIFFYKKNQFNETFGQGNEFQHYNNTELNEKNSYSIKLLLSTLGKLKKSAWISGYLYDKLPSRLYRALPIFYLLYCLLTLDSYLLRWK